MLTSIGSGRYLLTQVAIVWPVEGGESMVETRVRKNESLDTALRRFKRSIAKDGVLSEARKKERYDKPSVKRKKKAEAARSKKRK